jgi:hypothetical protein
MSKFEQKLKDGVRYAWDKMRQIKAKIKGKIKSKKLQIKTGIKNRIKSKALYIKTRLKAEKQMLKDALSWLKKNFQLKKKHHDIRKSLRRLAARSFWPKSVMEKYFQNEILPLVGTDAGLKGYMVVKGLAALPKVARNGAAASDFFAGLLDTVKKDPTLALRCAFVVEGVEALPALVKASPEASEKLVKGMLQIAGDNKDLNRRVYDATINALPVLAKYDHKLKPVMPALVNVLRTAAGDDLKQPIVYKELAVSPANPASGHTSLVISMGDVWWKEPYVSAGCFTGLASDFKKAVDKKYPDTKSPGCVHYDAVMNFVRNAFEIMSPQPSLHDAIKAKVMGTPPVTGTAWPVKKAG